MLKVNSWGGKTESFSASIFLCSVFCQFLSNDFSWMDEIAVKKHAGKNRKEEGRREGKIEEKREVAKKLLEIGVEISKIIEATGLNKEEIENLKQWIEI